MTTERDIKTSMEQILDEARICVCGHRKDDYGSPEDSFNVIAKLWNVYLGGTPGREDPNIDAKDVSMMMALLKVARISTGTGSHDSFVDLAGYAACGGAIADNQTKPCIATPDNTEWMGGGAEVGIEINTPADDKDSFVFSVISKFLPKTEGEAMKKGIRAFIRYDGITDEDQIVLMNDDGAVDSMIRVMQALGYKALGNLVQGGTGDGNDGWWSISRPHNEENTDEDRIGDDPFDAMRECVALAQEENPEADYGTEEGMIMANATPEEASTDMMCVLRLMGVEDLKSDQYFGDPFWGWWSITRHSNAADAAEDLFQFLLHYLPSQGDVRRQDGPEHAVFTTDGKMIYVENNAIKLTKLQTVLSYTNRHGIYTSAYDTVKKLYRISDLSHDSKKAAPENEGKTPYDFLCERLPKVDSEEAKDAVYLTTGDMLLAKDEINANYLADVLEDMGLDICTGSYAPDDAETGFWCIDIKS